MRVINFKPRAMKCNYLTIVMTQKFGELFFYWRLDKNQAHPMITKTSICKEVVMNSNVIRLVVNGGLIVAQTNLINRVVSNLRLTQVQVIITGRFVHFCY